MGDGLYAGNFDDIDANMQAAGVINTAAGTDTVCDKNISSFVLCGDRYANVYGFPGYNQNVR